MDNKQHIFDTIAKMITSWKYNVVNKDDARPWGGYYVIDESQAPAFIKQFFPEENIEQLKITQKLSPKILVVAPGARLSFQYHNRRSEIWSCIGGKVGVVYSDDDEERSTHTLKSGDTVKIPQGIRHRLFGLDDWGYVAEIWQHTDDKSPSNEDDIIRIQDDYGRD